MLCLKGFLKSMSEYKASNAPVGTARDPKTHKKTQRRPKCPPEVHLNYSMTKRACVSVNGKLRKQKTLPSVDDFDFAEIFHKLIFFSILLYFFMFAFLISFTFIFMMSGKCGRSVYIFNQLTLFVTHKNL